MTTTTDSSTQSKKKKIVAGTAAALSGAMLLAGSLAYFTDRVSTEATATAGTVDLALTEDWQDIENFNPGDIQNLDYSISNLGNKSIDVREKLVVTSSVAMTDGDQAEFEIYNKADVTQQANGSYVPNEGAQPVATDADRVFSDDGKTVVYSLAEYVLNGTGTGAETEDGISATEKEKEYVLVFKGASQNAFQGAEVSVELLAEAKQHRNTNADDWATVATEEMTLGGASTNVVPER